MITRAKTDHHINEPVKEKLPESTSVGNSANNQVTKSEAQKVSTISIKGALKSDGNTLNKPEEKEISKLEEPEIKIETKDFTQEQLLSAWNLYAESVKADKVRLYHILKAAQPVKKDENRIGFDVKNSLQKDAVEKFQSELMGFICSKLSNNTLALDINIIEDSQQQKTLYTDTDKLKYLTEKNPNLNTLKQKFGLDF
jgi:hypothetical protein